jgi:PRTRC genetic system protein A
MENVTSKAEVVARRDSGLYELFNYISESRTYRVESSPVSFIQATKGDPEAGTYEYRLPKIPGSILKDIVSFFILVGQTYQTEVLVRIYWDPEKREYFLELPDQGVTPSSVTTSDPLLYDMYPVMDIHSHCHFDAFFSSVDNQDEVGSRLYGVVGTVHDRPQFLLRAGTGGNFVSIHDPGQVFALDEETRDWYEELSAKMEDKVHPLRDFSNCF